VGDESYSTHLCIKETVKLVLKYVGYIVKPLDTGQAEDKVKLFSQ